MATTPVGDHLDFPKEDAAVLVAWLRGSGEHWLALGAALRLADYVYHSLTPHDLLSMKASATETVLTKEDLAMRIENAAKGVGTVGVGAIDWKGLLSLILKLLPLFI